jgi:hypothetical protein
LVGPEVVTVDLHLGRHCMGGVETHTPDGFGWYTRSACLYHQLVPSHISGNFQSLPS